MKVGKKAKMISLSVFVCGKLYIYSEELSTGRKNVRVTELNLASAAD